MPRCLIDADILAYECSFAGQFKDERTGEVVMKDFDYVVDQLHQKIKEIKEECMSDEEPLLFLTGDPVLARHLNRRPKWLEPAEQVELLPSFRYKEAVTKEYKGNRKVDKPLHYHNTRAYMLSQFEVIVSNGLEADDELAMYLLNHPDTILCTVDKDLRQVPGRHYSWSIGQRHSIPVYDVNEFGTMELVISEKSKKLSATGLMSFFAQVLMGDTVDNVQGIKGLGPVTAYEILSPCITEMELFLATANKYRQVYPEDWADKLREHIDLVYMIRELDDEGKPVRYKYPEGWQDLLGDDGL